MKYRNSVFTVDGRIDCEIEHPVYGWIPFTASPDDVEPLGREIFEHTKSRARPAPQADIAAILSEARAAAHEQVIAMINAAVSVITGPVPLAEMMSWTAKETAARAFLAAPESETGDILGGETAVTGETPEVLAAKIIGNADAYRTHIARLAGLRRNAVAAIVAAETLEAVDAAVDALKAVLTVAE